MKGGEHITELEALLKEAGLTDGQIVCYFHSVLEKIVKMRLKVGEHGHILVLDPENPDDFSEVMTDGRVRLSGRDDLQGAIQNIKRYTTG